MPALGSALLCMEDRNITDSEYFYGVFSFWMVEYAPISLRIVEFFSKINKLSLLVGGVLHALGEGPVVRRVGFIFELKHLETRHD